MAPIKASLSVKLNQWVNQHKYLTSNGKAIHCEACDKEVNSARKFTVDQHVRSEIHLGRVRKLESKTKGLKQTFLSAPMTKGPIPTEYSMDLCNAMIAANIPWEKLAVPAFKEFLDKYTEKKTPDPSTLRKNYLPAVYEKAIESIQDDIGDASIWISMDETTDAENRYIANLIIGKLVDDEPGTPHLLCSRVLDQTNYKTVSSFINDGLLTLWPGGGHNHKVLLLTSDAAPYMVKAGKHLQTFYHNMHHVTCLAHALHRVSETIRSMYDDVNALISNTKKVFLKAPSRTSKYREMLTGIPLPPEPILTRWGTWIAAAVFYCDHFDQVKSVIDTFDANEAASIKEAQRLFAKNSIICDLAYIKSSFGQIPQTITKLEAVGLPLTESLQIVNKIHEKLKTEPGRVARVASNKLDLVLGKNPSLALLQSVGQIHAGKEAEVHGLAPMYICKLKYAPITSVDVERSFSVYKNVLSDKRHRLTSENIEKIIVSHCYAKHTSKARK